MGGHADDGRTVYRAIFLIAYLCLGHVQMPIADRLQVGTLYTGMWIVKLPLYVSTEVWRGGAVQVSLPDGLHWTDARSTFRLSYELRVEWRG
jgi:hypothetical protein